MPVDYSNLAKNPEAYVDISNLAKHPRHPHFNLSDLRGIQAEPEVDEAEETGEDESTEDSEPQP